jgi:hypothetical protein
MSWFSSSLRNGIIFNTRLADGADALTLSGLIMSTQSSLLNVPGNDPGARLVWINQNEIAFVKSDGVALEFKINIKDKQIYIPAELALSINFNSLVGVLDTNFPRGWWWEPVGKAGEAGLAKVIADLAALHPVGSAASGGYRRSRRGRRTHKGRKHRKTHRKHRNTRRH